MNSIRSEEWFTKVFDRHYDHLRNYLYYLSGDISWADDAVQDVFMVVWEKRDQLREETLRPFIFKVGRNLFLKQKRRESVHLKFDKTLDDESAELSPEEDLEAREFDDKLQRTISGLPEKCRAVFLMSRLEEKSNKQIAESLNVTLKAVEKQITKALKIIRGKIDN
jgi:RNA polymerase sigma-70 factor (family 1)